MKTNRTLLLILLAFSIHVSAQKIDYTFKVLVNKGKNEVKAGNSWQLLKTGSVLKSGDEVKLSDNAYLGLIHSSGKPLEVKQPGTHKVDDLVKNMKVNTSVLNKYTDFMLSSNEEKRNKLSATGAVHRGAHTVKVYLPKSEAAFVYGNKITLHWEKEEDGPYMVNLKSVFGEDLSITETNDSTMVIDLGDPKYLNEDNIIVEVYPKGQPEKKPDPAYILKKLSSADKERIKVLLKEIPAEAMENNALSKSLLAIFYEENKLLIDASGAYQDAIKLAPDVQQFRDDYNSFLVRYAMKEQKK
jgi:hypothetical protein